MDKKWKKFERIVAAIHAAETQGAQVTWNEDIGGRQFDVVIRFRLGFYDYLTLIECKDYSKPVKAEKVDAFVTKSRKAGAHKAIMVATSGFQNGAKKVARDENIELYTLREVQSMSEQVFLHEFLSVLVIEPVGFLKADEEKQIGFTPHLPIDFQMANVTLDTMGGKTIGDIMSIFSQQLTAHDLPGVPHFGGDFKRATDKKQFMAVTLPIGTKATFQFNGEVFPVSKFGFDYWMQNIPVIHKPIFDPNLISKLNSKYEYKNELTEETEIIDAAGLELGFDTILEVGKFYTQPPLNFSYLVEDIRDGFAQLFVVESYQHGMLIQMRFTQSIEYQKTFVEITDKTEIKRLKELYESKDQNQELDPNALGIFSYEKDLETGTPVFQQAPLEKEPK